MTNLIKRKIQFIVLYFLYTGLVVAQQSGYPVTAYLSQINVSDISISPNGKYLALVATNDDFEKNKTIKKLWQYEINDKAAVVSKTEIPIYDNTISQLRWTKDSDFLVFKSKDSTGSSLFKVATANPKIISPVITEKEKLKKVSTFTILDDNTVVFFETFSPIKSKKDSIVIKFPKKRTVKHTTFKSFRFGSENIDSLFTIKANVSYFEVSPDKKKMIYNNFDPVEFYSSDLYANSHTYIIDSENGKQITQLTNDMVWDSSWWYTDDKVLSYFGGNPEVNSYNRSSNYFYLTDIKKNEKKNLITSFDGSVGNLIEWKDKKMIINANMSTSSNFFIHQEHTFKKVTDLKGAIRNFTNNRSKSIMAFSMIKNDAFEEVYIARSIEELNTPIKITNFNENLNTYDPPEIEKITWKNTAGKSIEGVVLWPSGKKRAKNLPLVVDIHGGPWSSRLEAITLGSVQYYYFASLLASKGFVVLLPNYSGSTGRGQEFMDAINSVPRTRPTDDIITGLHYMIDQKWVNKDNMIVKGASYGGLLTNSIIGETNMFKAALTSCGVWNEFADAGVGDGDISEVIRFEGIKPWEKPDLYRKESAVYNATKIKTPTLITHGENDVRVPTSNAYAMYYTLKGLGVETELLIFKDEGHIYRKPSSKLAKVKAELEFINRYIKL